ncbi:MAG: hypothetical protein AABX51_04440 [Nanoarchaeota archaeon]
MLFLTQTTGGKQFYCNNLANYFDKLGAKREDLCNEAIKLESEFGAQKIKNISLFPNKNIKYLASVEIAKPSIFQLYLTKDSFIRNASIVMQNGNYVGYITRFKDRDFTTVVNFGFNGGTQTLFVNLSKNSVVSRSKLKVKGYNLPGQLDLVFVIDQSASMHNEWAAICGIIDELKKNLSKTGLGVDVQSTIYGLAKLNDAKEGTFGSCRDKVIKKDDLDPIISALGISFPLESAVLVPPDIYNYPPYDRYDEAWGLGVYWAATKHPWRTNTKKIVFPISDSDPTGGGPASLRVNQNSIIAILKDAVFSGNEGTVIDAADQVSQNNGIYVFPIYGDQNPNEPDLKKIEGYNVGLGSTTCDPNTDMNCGCDPLKKTVCMPIINWMRKLSHYNQSRLAAYRSGEDLKVFMQYVLATNYPHEVTIKVGGKTIFFQPGALDDGNSPAWVNEQEFKNALETASQLCAADSCLIPVEVSSSTEGAVVLTDLEILYQRYIKDAELLLNNDTIFFSPKFVLANKIDFTDKAREIITDCTDPDCTIEFRVKAGEKAQILLSNLSIEYSRVFIDEDVLDAVVYCYEKAKDENFVRNLRCNEFSIPPSYIFYKEFNESSLTDLIIKRKWCTIFENSDYNCGIQDHLRFLHSFNIPTNILVEYDAASKQVVVS